jgi:uncharacterized membrane protein YgcG
MRLQPLLSVFLFVLVFCCPVATGQQPSTLNLRRGAILSEPGVPTVEVTVDRRRVPLGTLVTFTLTPSNVVRSSLYTVTIYFGDGKQQSVSATQVPHLYQAVGTYIYSVRVKSKNRPPAVSLRATPVSVSPDQKVSFSAQTSWTYPNLQYRFSFGDGSTSGWQDSPRTNHAYQAAGKYSAYVDIGDGSKQIGGSTRKVIDVITRAQPLRVSLTANPSIARARGPVTFVARAFPFNDNTKYRFLFGDSQVTGWQSSSQAQHAYENAGRYSARVEATQFYAGSSVNATSAPAIIAVQRAPTPNPSPGPTPKASPGPTPKPSPQSTPASTPSPSPDGASSPSPSTTPTGSGSPFGSTSPSPNESNSPTPTGSNENGGNSSSSTGGDTSSGSGSSSSSNEDSSVLGSSRGWWWYLLIIALILFLIYQLGALLFVAKPTFKPFADQGVPAVVDRGRGLAIDFQLVLNPNVSAGWYGVETTEPSLVRNADKLGERQILEI